MNDIDLLCTDIANLKNMEADVRSRLLTNGPVLIAEARQQMSLREVARRTGLSATYLSLVGAGKLRMSAKAFVRVAEISLLGVDDDTREPSEPIL